MRLSIPTSFFFLLLSLAAVAGNDDDFTIYNAKFRRAEELKQAAVGLGNGARVSVMNNKVIVAGTKAQRAAVLSLFGELDHKLKNYLVSLRIADRAHATREEIAVKRKGKIHVESQEQDDLGNIGQSVRVMDGGSAYIASGSLFSSSVTVRIRSIGKSAAHVEIEQKNPSASGEQALLTELEIPLGEWRTMGGLKTQGQGRTSEILGRGKSESIGSRDIQIKVVAEP